MSIIYIHMRFALLSSMVCLALMFAMPQGTEAASVGISLRTGMVDAINSITLGHASSTVYRNEGTLPIALYEVNFSITAFEEDVMIPTLVARGATDAPDVEFFLESRHSTETTSGFAGGFITSDAERNGNAYRIPEGESEDFTLFIAYTDTPDSSREDRVRLRGMTMRAGDSEAKLNENELFDIRSGFAELIETR